MNGGLKSYLLYGQGSSLPYRSLSGEQDTVLASTAVTTSSWSPLSHCPISSSLKAAQQDVLALLKVLKEARSNNQSLHVTTQAALSLVDVSYNTCITVDANLCTNCTVRVCTCVHATCVCAHTRACPLASRSCTYWLHPPHPLPPVCWPSCWNSEVQYVRPQRPGSLCAA